MELILPVQKIYKVLKSFLLKKNEHKKTNLTHKAKL